MGLLSGAMRGAKRVMGTNHVGYGLENAPGGAIIGGGMGALFSGATGGDPLEGAAAGAGIGALGASGLSGAIGRRAMQSGAERQSRGATVFALRAAMERRAMAREAMARGSLQEARQLEEEALRLEKFADEFVP